MTREVKVKNYDKKLDYSYSIGVYPTIELFTYKKEKVSKIYVHSKGTKNQGIQKLKTLCEKNNVSFEINDNMVGRITKSSNNYAFGVFDKYTTSLGESSNHIVLSNISDMGNLGTIIRTMLGFGFKDLALIRPSADIFDPKVIRASMGALFQINFEYFDNFDKYLSKFPSHTKYSFVLSGGKSIRNYEFSEPSSLIFGNEGQGLGSEVEGNTTKVFIPQTKNIDSLNLSVAVGISMYEFSRLP